MFRSIWALFSRQKDAKLQRIVDLQEMSDIDFDEDDDKTEMIDTLAYHQPSKESISEKALRLANGGSQ